MDTKSTEPAVGFQTRLRPLGQWDAFRAGSTLSGDCSGDQTAFCPCPMCGSKDATAVTIWEAAEDGKPSHVPAFTAFVCYVCRDKGMPLLGVYADGIDPE